MAFLQKKPQLSSSAPLYTIGTHKTVLIIGLGNPGEEYEDTRHNIGFKVIDHFARLNDFPGWINKGDLKNILTMANLGQTRVILAKPTTLMNQSGEAVQLIQHFYRLYNHSTVVVYDELVLQFGTLRTRIGGSDAGHNGIKSIIKNIGGDFGRIRVGIGSKPALTSNQANYVLNKFTKNEQQTLPLIIREAATMISEYVYSGQLPHDTRKVV